MIIFSINLHGLLLSLRNDSSNVSSNHDQHAAWTHQQSHLHLLNQEYKFILCIHGHIEHTVDNNFLCQHKINWYEGLSGLSATSSCKMKTARTIVQHKYLQICTTCMYLRMWMLIMVDDRSYMYLSSWMQPQRLWSVLCSLQLSWLPVPLKSLVPSFFFRYHAIKWCG